MADKLDVTQPQMSAWENDRFGTPTGETLFRFAKAIGCTIEELLSGLDGDYDQIVRAAIDAPFTMDDPSSRVMLVEATHAEYAQPPPDLAAVIAERRTVETEAFHLATRQGRGLPFSTEDKARLVALYGRMLEIQEGVRAWLARGVHAIAEVSAPTNKAAEHVKPVQPPADTSVTQTHHQEEADSLTNGGLPLPDLDLLGDVLGVWRLLRTREARNAFKEHARDYLGLPREEARRKKARR